MTEAMVGIIMGSDSDLPVMKDAAQVLEELAIPYEITVVSAHRTPQRMVAYAQSAESRGLCVIIAGAGGAAHLPGMVASMTDLPVIGVPIQSRTLNGLDSLLSIVQMPSGIPVATVAIQNARNAGLLAARILAAFSPALRMRLRDFRAQMEDSVLEKAHKLEAIGYHAYLAGDTSS
jgi:5-(carboxyamino)imidazole ribonucleotide mutase